MKTILKFPIFLVVCFSLFWTSCQKESEELIDETTDEETISFDSPLTRMLLSASQNNGFLDNILDGSGCLSIALPVTVIANEQQIVIQDEGDYALVAAIFNEFANDIDSLEIIFPISVVFEDFNILEVGSQAVLETIIAACQNNIDDTYTCIDFQYPIDCFIYNNTTEETGLITLTNDFEWFEYLNYLNPEVFISIKYPMGVITETGTTIVRNNDELQATMEATTCNLNEGIIDPVQFESKLTAGSWYVNLYDENGSDDTCDYVDYEFHFFENGTATAINDFENRVGTWSLESVDDTLKLNLDFEFTGTNDPFQDITDRWTVLQSTTQTIKLLDDAGYGDVDYLYFGREAAENCSMGNGQELIDTLLDGTWFVQSYLDDGTDETSAFQSYQFDFQSGGIVIASNSIYTYYGSWNVLGIEELDLLLDFGNQIPLIEFNDEWDVINFSQTLVELQDVSGGGGGTDRLTFGKL